MVEIKPSYDVVVVGARCAGAAAAMLLARAGLRVLAVDRGVYGSDTLSTHALMRPAVMQLARWDLLESLIRSGSPVIASSTFHYGEQQVPVAIRPEPDIPGLIAPRRTVLDRLLVDAARGDDATVVHETMVRELVFDAQSRVRGVVLADAGGRIRSVEADYVVGADGMNSLVARLVDAPVVVSGRASVAHIFGYAPVPPGISGYHWYFTPDGAGGVIPTNEGLACIVASIPSHLFDGEFRSNLAQGYRRVLEKLSPGLGEHAIRHEVERVKAFRGAPGRVRKAFGPGWILIGDAGFFRDPLTSHGISDALRDAEGAATAIVSDHPTGFNQFQDERDGVALPILSATDAVSAFDWSLADLPERHKRFSEAMKAEVAILNARSTADRRAAASLWPGWPAREETMHQAR
jgi:2-polyprenyl-6-methoxyphenol hydroxylase-like FAD-dependent oxidoreductase